MTSDNRDDKAKGVLEKAERYYERIDPLYRDLEPDFLPNLRDWVVDNPIHAHSIVALISRTYDFSLTQIGLQQGGATGGKAKAELYRHYEQVLVDLARPFAPKLKCKQLSYPAVAHNLKIKVIPEALRKANQQTSPDAKALEHLATRSERRLTDIIRKHKAEIVPPSP